MWSPWFWVMITQRIGCDVTAAICFAKFRVSGWLLPVSTTTTPCFVTIAIALASLSLPT